MRISGSCKLTGKITFYFWHSPPLSIYPLPLVLNIFLSLFILLFSVLKCVLKHSCGSSCAGIASEGNEGYSRAYFFFIHSHLPPQDINGCHRNQGGVLERNFLNSSSTVASYLLWSNSCSSLKQSAKQSRLASWNTYSNTYFHVLKMRGVIAGDGGEHPKGKDSDVVHGKQNRVWAA